MNAHKDNSFGEYLKNLFEEHGITSTRQGRIRTGISHTTLEEIIKGRQPSVESTIRIAEAFHQDVAEALRLAGHEHIAEVWENRGEADGKAEHLPDTFSESRATYQTDIEIEEVVAAYQGIPENIRPTILAMMKAAIVEHERDKTTHGKKAE